MASLRSRLFGHRSTRIPLIIGVVLSVVATAGQTFALTSDNQDEFGLGMFVILGVNGLIGLVSVFGSDPWANPASTDEKVKKASTDAQIAALGVIVAAVAIQLALGFVLAVVVGFTEQWDEPSILLSPLAFAGLVGVGGGLAGFLVGLLVVWPIIKLVDVVVRLITGRAVVAGVAPLCLLLIATVAAAIFTVLAPHADVTGTPRGRGLALLVGVWFDYSGTTDDQVFAWTARVLQLVIAGTLVWLVLDLRASRRRKRESAG